MEKIKIAILDSGVKTSHKEFIGNDIKGFSLIVCNDIVIKHNDFEDEIGHGTAVYYLINKLTKNVCITNVKIYNSEGELKEKDFVRILDYLYNNFSFDIINVSMGIIRCSETIAMQDICNKFYKKGTIIVAAFNNEGAISFPAALNNVLGVDSFKHYNLKEKYKFLEQGIVDVIGRLFNQRVAWTDPEYNIVRGNSFFCCYVTSYISKLIQEKKTIKLREKLTFTTMNQQIPYTIKRAAIFPFNKEIHSIARYEELLNFAVVDYYNIRMSGTVGKNVGDIIKGSKNNKIIKNIDDIIWDDFDTLILGHLDEISFLTKKDYKKFLVQEAISRKKNIYSFDLLDQYISEDEKSKVKIYSPKIDNTCVIKRYGKLFKTSIPELTIVGTSSNQGKFTLQLLLRKKFIDCGYNIGQIGTEPSALLFNMDHVYPSGYNSTVKLNNNEIFMVTNQMIWNISNKNVDIILSGTQGGFLAYNEDNVSNFPIRHQIFFEALQPDAIILCINSYDELEFVERIIKTAEGLSGGKVIAAVCYPMEPSQEWCGNFGRKIHIEDDKIIFLKEQYKRIFNLDLYMLDSDYDLNQLFKNIINFFK